MNPGLVVPILLALTLAVVVVAIICLCVREYQNRED